MLYHTAGFYTITDPMVLLNYGLFEIHNPKTKNDLLATGSIRGYNAEVIVQKNFT